MNLISILTNVCPVVTSITYKVVSVSAFSLEYRAFNQLSHISKRTQLLDSRGSLTKHFFSTRGGGGSSSTPNPALTARINGEGYQTDEDDQNSRKAQTGWNHNLPGESSSFWSEESELSAASKKKENTRTEVRTGWLHNTKSAAQIEDEKKAEKEQQKKNQEGSEGKVEKKQNSLEMARKMLRDEKIKNKVNHRIISAPTFHPCGEGRRAVVTEHKISVPLDRYNPPEDELDDEPMIDVFFRIAELVNTPEDESFFNALQQHITYQSTTPLSKAKLRIEQQKLGTAYKAFAALKNADECILYLQGGPGFGAPSPICDIGLGDKSSWVGAALGKGFKRVVLMDQRGTGRSTTITKQTLQKRFPDLFALDDVYSSKPHSLSENDDWPAASSDWIDQELNGYVKSHPGLAEKVQVSLKEASDYMANFRADNIVIDAEAVKDALLLPMDENEGEDTEVTPRPWGASLGQSFGGFCMMSYLSIVKNPPKICILTGGIAPMLTNVDDVYSSLRERVKERNLKFYDRYPGDIMLVKRIVKVLGEKPASLPSGGKLTARRFLQLGISLGGSPSAFASMHNLISSAFISDDGDDLSRAFLKGMDSVQPFDDHPIYYLLHESIYADGDKHSNPTKWAAHRAYKIWDQADMNYKASLSSNDSPTFLFGEVVFPWMSDGDYAEVSGLGMLSLANSLAFKDDWKSLYNAENMRKALADDGTGVSKAAAAVYYEDMYVDFDASMKVAARGGPLEKCKVWVTNDFQHSGLRDDGASIFCKLLGMAKGTENTPS